ncbi:hypothetical protein DFP72DRAFT_1076362 [Ephemerocybe angulata]|uniref:F-box domain-containing protein n=1 Tax=Ephemerocybe angulata TaxID=980116 RepID=A0A8H6LVS4_9AGAR|nr:hypothetical protein DFP72DRAFT_1078550 [Tulosesus angulatus]KAF6746523.1 hypothetical protein DFP72DRAFT_1076362 [Tulosesus angulatus]
MSRPWIGKSKTLIDLLLASTIFTGAPMDRATFFSRWRRLPNELKCHTFGFLSLSDVISFCDISLQFRVFAIECLRLRLSDLTANYDIPLYTLLLILDRSNSVISGSTALELVHPTGLTPRNLDFICPNQEADAVCSFLMSKEYIPIAEAPVHPLIIDDVPGRNCIESVRRLRHSVKGSIIQVIVSTSSSPLATVFSFHSTFVMNFISANGMYSCYPKMTERNVGVRNVTDKMVQIQPRRLLDQEKYERRGFSFVEGCPPLSDRFPHIVGDTCLHLTRSVTDPSMAVLPFDIFRSSCSFWPKTGWRLGCRIELPSGEVVTAETLIEVDCDGTETWIHGNNPGRVSLIERAMLGSLRDSLLTT